MNAAAYFTQLAPEWILLIGACVALFLGVTRWAERASLVPTVTLLTIGAALAVTLAGSVPDGTFASVGLWTTSLTHYARCIGLGLGLLILLVNWNQPLINERGEYMAMILFSLLGVLLTASANDWIVLFLAIELVSVPTYVLIALSRDDARAAESSVKYFFLGALAAAILAYGLSFLYGASGTTALFQIVAGRAASTLPENAAFGGFAQIGLLLVIGGLAFKIAAVPFHAYAPDVYEGAASPITGMLGFVPKFAGFVALVRVVSVFHWNLPESILWLLWLVAAATMTLGNVLALLQKNVKRMLAYSSIAHSGYMLIALLVGPVAGEGPMRDGVSALFFYIAVYGAMNLGAFALLTAFSKGGRPVETLDDLAGLSTRAPIASLAFAVCIFSLMGFPPTAGFIGKLYLFSGAFSVGADHAFHAPLLALGVIGVVNSAIGAAYYLRIVAAAYTGQQSGAMIEPAGGIPVRWGLAICAVTMVALFARPSLLSTRSTKATDVLRQSLAATESKLTTATEPHPSEPRAQATGPPRTQP